MSGFSDLKGRIFYALVIAVVGLACISTKPTTAALIAFLIAVFVVEVASKLRNNPVLSAKGLWVTAAFATASIAGFVCAYVIRINKHGLFNLLLVALAVAVTDSLAYGGGKKFGRRKLAPKISPHKTVEGAFCGVAAGWIVLLVVWEALRVSNNTSLSLTAILWTMLLPPLAVAGDLLESWSKRQLGIKDFGKILGPHGGIADRFDAMTAGFLVLESIILLTS